MPAGKLDRCLSCRLRARIVFELSGGTGTVDEQLAPFVTRLARAEDLEQVYRWLKRGPAAEVLREMAQGRQPVAHATLDAAGGDRRGRATAIEHLRRLLVAAEVLPQRDESWVRLERDVDTKLASLDPADASVLRRFVSWYTLPRTRQRIELGRDPQVTCQLARDSLAGPIRFLNHLRAIGLPLARVGQADLEMWLAADPGSIQVMIFLRWARRQHLTPALQMPTQRMQVPREFAEADAQWHLARRCLTDESLPNRTRLAGCLVLLYGQQAAVLVRLRRLDVRFGDGQVRIQLGPDQLVLDEPLASVAMALAGTAEGQPRGIARAFTAEDNQWLFSGRGPGKPLGAAALRRDLAKLGIRTRQGRNTALLALARDVPPMILSELLGVAPSTAERWRGYAGGAWTSYVTASINPTPRQPATR